jgi:hypothetical protein
MDELSPQLTFLIQPLMTPDLNLKCDGAALDYCYMCEWLLNTLKTPLV